MTADLTRVQKMNKLQGLYNDFVQSEEYADLCENEETLANKNKIREALNCVLAEEQKVDIADLIANYAVSHEELGFLNGFRYAMQIMTDCVPEKVVEKVGATV